MTPRERAEVTRVISAATAVLRPLTLWPATDVSRRAVETLRAVLQNAAWLANAPPTVDEGELDALAAHVANGWALELMRVSALIEALREERASSAALAAELEELRARPLRIVRYGPSTPDQAEDVARLVRALERSPGEPIRLPPEVLEPTVIAPTAAERAASGTRDDAVAPSGYAPCPRCGALVVRSRGFEPGCVDCFGDE
jgi:hypothetical protein